MKNCSIYLTKRSHIGCFVKPKWAQIILMTLCELKIPFGIDITSKLLVGVTVGVYVFDAV